ncbi:MAG: C40 family peptidase [Synergistaceae bacterium]|jgi:cell wall-associated NlpC family hydrolase|nr:C40 family peptidase [Synergistaceae bacterium]
MRVTDLTDLTGLIGKPFIDGGRGPDGYDCWGLVCEVFRRGGIELRDYRDFNLSCYDSEGFCGLFEKESLRWTRHEPPDIPVPAVVTIRFNHPIFVNHVGVYVGGGKFLHTREKTGVCIERLDSPCWRHKIEGFYTPEGGHNDGDSGGKL